MKSIILLFVTLCFSCTNEVNSYFESETNEHFTILKEEIAEMPVVPLKFFRREPTGPVINFATSCLTSEVKFEKPYLVANGQRFHAYYWIGTAYERDSTIKISRVNLTFSHEK